MQHIMQRSTLLMLGLLLFFSARAQEESEKTAPDNWFHLDYDKDGYYGVSTGAAYELLKGKEGQEVIVAVIDSGIDFEHEDLNDNIWVNEDEVAGDGKDNDNNGYVDDVHGWSFIGGKEGDVAHDTYELTRVYKDLKEKYEGKDREEVSDKEAYDLYTEVKAAYEKKLQDITKQSMGFMGFYNAYGRFNRLMTAYLNKPEDEPITMEDLEAIETEDPVVQQAKELLVYSVENEINAEEMEDYMEYLQEQVKYGLSLEHNPRKLVGDDYEDPTERDYGNNHIEGPDARHGTHVAGIIAAERDNGVGMDGIADKVKIMVLRAVPSGGDERDKDIASAVYYAVDNGAKIINMSFGKSYSPYKGEVDKAMRYAESKGVLLVHAAGNDGQNTEDDPSYPTVETTEGELISTWLEIGASSWHTDEKLPASFSNHGERIDVFAPGVAIYASVPDNKYEKLNGTSMAAPVTSGVAALLMSYFPELSAKEVKEIILESAVSVKKKKVHKPGTGGEEEEPEVVKFKELAKTPAIVNAREAVERAEKIARKK